MALLYLVEHRGRETSCLALAATALAARAKPSPVDSVEKGWATLQLRTEVFRPPD